MAGSTTTPLPIFTDTVDLRWFIEPTNGPTPPGNFLDRFPDEVYNKAPDSHLVRFMYTLLGPAGIGWLKKNLLDARLVIADHGFELFDLERFYGDPFSFGRILDELYDEDPTGLLPRDIWDQIKAKDERYRSRARDFFNAARLGNSPPGMLLAAKSGLGHNVGIVENYRYLFDVHSDNPMGLAYFGSTVSTQEFIVRPRQEISRTEVQTLTFDSPINGGNFVLVFNGQGTAAIPYTATNFDVQTALRALRTIGPNAITVTGGPIPDPFVITFSGTLSNQDVTELRVITSLTDSTTNPISIRNVTVTTTVGGVESTDEAVVIPPADRHALQTSLDFLRPVGSIPSVYQGRGLRSRQGWQRAFATSEYTEVLRYVTGTPSVSWPAVEEKSRIHWIVGGIEKQAPRVHQDLQHHYVGFHNTLSVTAFTDEALADPAYETSNMVLTSYNSEHIGRFIDDAAPVPFLSQFTDDSLVFTADRVLADYAEPLTVTTQNDDSTAQFINGIYPTDYANLSGVPQIKYHDDQFWASRPRTAGSEILEIDLGMVQAVNFITLEIMRLPVDIEIAYDVLDQSPRRHFNAVTPLDPSRFSTRLFYDALEANPWEYIEYHFTDQTGSAIFTRFIRISFTRRSDDTSLEPRFLFNPTTQVQSPWSIEARNLRVGRNVVA